MKKFFWIFIFLILAIWPTEMQAADEPIGSAEQAFQAASDKYISGDYRGAISGFQNMLESGWKSGNVLYNLGNSYIKSGKLGYAILSYEQARLFIPRDNDLISNYQYARTLVKQKETALKKSFLLIGLDIVFSHLTLRETYFIFMFFYYLIASMVIVVIFVSQARRYLIPSIAVLSVMWISVSIPLVGKVVDSAVMGVTVSDIIDAKFEPSARAAVNFPLYAGMRVHILSTKGEWRKVKRLDGRIGWVERSSVEPISEEAQKL